MRCCCCHSALCAWLLLSIAVEAHGDAALACDEDLLLAYWDTLKAHGVRPVEIEAPDHKVTKKMTEGGTNILEFKEEVALIREAVYQGLRRKSPLATVCQTGFNAGASALAFLCGTPPSVRVHSFDIGTHDYVAIGNRLLATKFGYATRHNLVRGSSLLTLPAMLQKGKLRCDFAFVDGGHTFEIAMSDINMFRQMSRPGTPIVVENCNVFGRVGGWGGIAVVNNAYNAAVDAGNITHVKQISTGPCHKSEGTKKDSCRELCVGEFKRGPRSTKRLHARPPSSSLRWHGDSPIPVSTVPPLPASTTLHAWTHDDRATVST